MQKVLLGTCSCTPLSAFLVVGDSDVEMLRSDWDAFIKRKFPEVSITGKRPVSRRGQPGKHVGHKEPAKPPGYAVRPKDESFRSYGIPTREDEPI